MLTQRQINNFWAKVARGNGCWIWTGSKNRQGYGQFQVHPKSYRAHRIAFFIHYGRLNQGLLICHSCDNPSCVRPEHLFEGTAQQNIQDCINKNRRKYYYRTRCKNGHLFTEKNTYHAPTKRVCKACRRTVDFLRSKKLNRVEHSRKSSSEYRLNNPEKIQAYIEKNRDSMKTYQSEWYKKNKKKHNEQGRLNRLAKKNPPQRR